MTKGNKAVIAVLSVLLIIGIAAAVITSGLNTQAPGGSVEDYSTFRLSTDYPLVQSADKKIFYEPYPDGKISFFRVDKADTIYSFDRNEIKTVSTKLDISYQKVPVKIYYLETENGNMGYGIFTAEQESDVKLLSYVFVRLMKTPDSFKKAAGTDYILLADTDAADAYKPNKTYSEIYSFNMSSGKAERLISQRDRTAQEDGTVNTGWTVFTDDSINTFKKFDLFASTRIHDSKAEDKLYCIMDIENSDSMRKTSAYKLQDSPSCEIREKDGAWYCLSKTDSGFDIVKNGDKKNPVGSVEGSFRYCYISGDWMFNKLNCEFINIYTGETKSVNSFALDGFAGFAADESGTKFAVFVNGEKTQSVIYCNTADDTQKYIENDGYDSGIGNFCFIDDAHILLTNYDEEGRAYNMIISV